MEKIRYPPQILDSFNRKGVYGIEPDLAKFFAGFPKTKFATVPYGNPHNTNFPTQLRKVLFTPPESFTDEKLIADFRSHLVKLTADNKTDILDQLAHLHFAKGCEDKLAQAFYETAINCIFLVGVYVDVLIVLSEKNSLLADNVTRQIVQQLYNPRIFSSANDDTACETGEQKTKKWRINNGILLGEMFNRGKYTADFMVNCLTHLVGNISQTDAVNVEVINKLLPAISAGFKGTSALAGVVAKLTDISKDKTYPSRLRCLLMDVLEKL